MHDQVGIAGGEPFGEVRGKDARLRPVGEGRSQIAIARRAPREQDDLDLRPALLEGARHQHGLQPSEVARATEDR